MCELLAQETEPRRQQAQRASGAWGAVRVHAALSSLLFSHPTYSLVSVGRGHLAAL